MVMVMVYPITPQSQFKNNSRATVPLTTPPPEKKPALLILFTLFPRKVKPIFVPFTSSYQTQLYIGTELRKTDIFFRNNNKKLLLKKLLLPVAVSVRLDSLMVQLSTL